MKRLYEQLRNSRTFMTGLGCFLVLLTLSSSALAQSRRVQGQITDANGVPLFGVTVFEKGTVNNGVVSSEDGTYSITVAGSESVLLFSSIGFVNQETTVGNRSTINIILEEDFTTLEEVVVVGYGTEKKVNLSGAVDQVNAAQLEKRPISNITQGLQGVVPNLNIMSNSGAPGASANINIRGITSINGGSPLILIDGVPSSTTELNRIAPQDVESISIIKDASAAAIYGARAAFGVVLITTKNGDGKVKVNYTGYVSFNRPTVTPNKITDPYIYSRLLETSTDNTPWDNINFSDEYYAWAKQRSEDPSTPGVRVNPNDASLWDYMGDRDWTNYFLKDNTVSSNHQLSISGGQQNVNYLLSASYSRDNGVMRLAEDYFDRYTVRSKVNFKPTPWLTVGNNTYLTTTERKQPSYFDLSSIYNLHPTDWNLNPDGTWANSGAGVIGAQLTQGGESITEYSSLQSQFTTQVDLIKDKLTWNNDFTFRRGRQDWNWYRTKYQIGYGPGDVREQGDNRAYRSNAIENYYVFNSYMKFNQTFGNDHDLSVTAGFNQEHNRYNSFSAERLNVISASLPTIALATGDQYVDEAISEWAVRGLFYRLNYIFKDRYIVEFNGRYDGSSKFPSDQRWGFFPSASVAWRVDEENFMSGMTDVFSQLKLRASIGSLGNQAIGPYDYIATMSAYQGNYLIGGSLPLEISAPPLVSGNFTWEKVITTNFGVDMAFLDNKLTASFDIYRRDTKDMLTLGYTVRSKVNFKPTPWLTVGNNTYLTTTERKQPSYFDLSSIYNLHPTDWNLNPDGTWANSGAGVIGAQLTQGGESITEYSSLQSQFTTQVDLIKDKLTWNNDFTFRRGRQDWNWYRTKYQIGYGPGDVREQGDNRAYRSNAIENYYVFNSYMKFNQTFGNDHDLSVTAGFNQEHNRYNSFSAERLNVISASLPTIALATGDQYVDEAISEWAVRGLFYRLNYIFKDRYIVEFNGRYDGSSKFPSDQRWGFFPSASVAWRVDEENFMSGMTDVFSQLKLRASIGSLGNQAIGPYDYIATMSAYQGNYLIGGSLPLEISAPPLVSGNFTWEKVITTNFGVDMAFLDNKLTASFDIYRRDTKDMLTLGKELPDVLGATEPRENAADLKTNGWELSLGYQGETMLGGKPLTFNVTGILSDSRTYITRFDNPTGSITQYYEGMELGQIWGLINDGFFENTDQISDLDESSIIPWGALSIVPGWMRYKDLDGNGVIEKGLTLDDTKDLTVIGNQAPRYSFGLNFGANWNGFDISGLVQGIGQRDYYPQDYLYWGFYQQPYAGGYAHLFDFYRGTTETGADRDRHSQSYIDAGLADQNLDAKYPHLQSWLADRNLGERIDEAQGLAIPQTDYMLSAAYVRLKNLTIGYTLPESLTQGLGIANLRVYVSGENLAEWSELKDFFDPEAVNDAIQYNPAVSQSRSVGKGYSYPFQRRYVVGLNIGF